ncbi:MAG: AlwI family type II restriction endonuclease [Endomicrobia bacterium]|nr:AlwI family type II restriction endonuclease [Endomicrobiia bacterium]
MLKPWSISTTVRNPERLREFLIVLQQLLDKKWDNAIRYFRLTKFIRIRGNGFYVDLEPNRRTEIESLFEKEFYKPGLFTDKKSYLNYMANDGLPILPWQTKNKLIKDDWVIGIQDVISSWQNTLLN